MSISVLGIDIGKNNFHLFDGSAKSPKGALKKMKRHKLMEYIASLEPRVIAMEACAGVHHLARKFQSYGHAVRLMAPQYVKPYVQTNKNDYNDAEAICEAAGRPGMRFVPIKSSDQQAAQLLHRLRSQAIKQRTEIINEIRAALLEDGITVAQGARNIRSQMPAILEDAENGLNDASRELLNDLSEQLMALDKRIRKYDDKVHDQAESDDDCKRLMTTPGIGPLIATAIKTGMGSSSNFQSGRHFAAWLGLVPRQSSTGGKPRMLGISKRGNAYLRTLLVHGARAILYSVKSDEDRCKKWVTKLHARTHGNVAVVALANKLARICWAILATQQAYNGAA